MKKIWIIHSSDYGNSEKIAKQLAEGLKDIYDVSVDHIKNITPEQVANDEPYGLIAAIRILQFSSDRKVRKFLKNLNESLKKPISKFAYFSTHALKWKKFFIRGIKKTVKKVGCFEEVCPEYLEVRLQGAEGPFREGEEAKVKEYLITLRTFLQ